MKVRPQIPSDPYERRLYFEALNVAVLTFFLGIAVGLEMGGVSRKATLMALGAVAFFAVVPPRFIHRISEVSTSGPKFD